MEVKEQFIHTFTRCFEIGALVKITLSKPAQKSSDLKNVYLRRVEIKDLPFVQFLYRYTTNDQTKNLSLEEAEKALEDLLGNHFLNAICLSLDLETEIKFNKKREGKLFLKKVTLEKEVSTTNNREKVKRAELNDPYLYHLGVTTKEGALIPKMADKYRQINKYLEIFESLWEKSEQPDLPQVVDMGSGKGYLTFALYDFLNNKLDVEAKVTGIELRKELVDYCNGIAQKCGFENLTFVNQRIEDLEDTSIDILIALHACDTATDDALGKGIISNAKIIICAPCCHKQIRQQLKGVEPKTPILKYGIFKERQYEMVTDTIRALMLEKNSYKTKVFEFVSNEHTRKNIMLVGTKSATKADGDLYQNQINELKAEYGIEYHYLEKVLE